jgi:hypothetical protein
MGPQDSNTEVSFSDNGIQHIYPKLNKDLLIINRIESQSKKGHNIFKKTRGGIFP